MKTLRILLYISTFFFISCNPGVPERAEPEELIPGSAQMVLKIKNTERFRSEYRNSEILKALLGPDTLPWRESIGTVLELDPPAGSLLVLADSLVTSADWLLLLPAIETPTDTLENSKTNSPATPWELPDNVNVHFSHFRNIPILASSKSYLDRVLKEASGPPSGIQKALVASNPLAIATLVLVGSRPDLLGMDLQDIRASGTLKNPAWSSYDLMASRNSFGLQYMESASDSADAGKALLGAIHVLSLQRTATLIPRNTHTWISYSLQQPEQFSENQLKFLGVENPHLQLLESVEQISRVEAEDSEILILHSLNASLVEEALRPFSVEGTEFQGVLVYALQQTSLFRETFAPLLESTRAPRFYTAFEDAFVFSESLEALQSLISEKNREDTFDQTDEFQKLLPLLASESSILLISKKPLESNLVLDTLVIGGMSAALANRIPDGYVFASQWNLENDFNLASYQFLDTDLLTEDRAGARELFTVELESAVVNRPQFLKNHLNGSMDIAVQDENNTLYLYSNSGEMYWKKDLESPIQGDIQQVDLFKNGRLQMAFTTHNSLMVLDRNGKTVAPFPKTFEGGNLNPLAVFDYEQNRNYRLVVTQGSRVNMYDTQGRPVAGFKFKDAGSSILRAPEHFRFGSRDYLVFQLENGQLKILNRAGDERISLKERFEFSANKVFGYRNGFAFTDRKGNLISIDTGGKIARSALNLNPDHGMDASTKTMTLMDDNNFRVKSNKKVLDLGVYTRPQLFYINDVIYVAVTDLQSQQVRLFRSTAEEVTGFPVEGSGLSDMADMDNDRNVELVTPYRKNGIRVYRVGR